MIKTPIVRRPTRSGERLSRERRGSSSLDYVLVLSTTLPMVAFIIATGKQIMSLVWEMACVQIASPFL